MRGFTVVELLIVFAIGATLAVFSVSSYFKYRDRSSVEVSKNKIVTFLRTAQERSTDQASSSQWGVHFDNVSPSEAFYAIFLGPSYATSSMDLRGSLGQKVIFLNPTSSQSFDVVFNKITGLPVASATIRITDLSASAVAEVIVNAGGLISEQ